MIYYDTDKMMDLLEKASNSDKKAIEQINQLKCIYAVAKDYSQMIIVQKKQATVKDGLFQWRNCKPDSLQNSIYVADIYTNSGTSWSAIPVPPDFEVIKVEENNNVWSFVSRNNTISGTITQIKKAMTNVVFSLKGASKSDILNSFYAIPNTIVVEHKPKTAKDNPPFISKTMGELEFNEDTQVYEGNFLSVYISIDCDTYAKAKKILPKIEEKINRMEEIDKTAKICSAKKLLKLKNDTWLDEDETEINEDEFIAKMKMESISFYANGAYSLYYADGDIFWGHSIVVNFSRTDIPKDAQIAG
ncbi:hypothetical protein FACS189430_04130 [Bacteroidia bacterium]|nr:hypothetical protein FACS189430_04130 [Bacteroidia bacterium]